MKEEKRIEASDIERAQVKLGAFMGFEPGRWVPVAWGLALAAILFLLLVMPGLKNYGSYLRFEGKPAEAAILLDGVYKGSTASSLYFPAGDYALTLQKTGFAPLSLRLKVSGRRIGSLFFPKVQKVPYDMEAAQPELALRNAFVEYASWSATGKSSGLYQIPSVLGDTVMALASTGSLDDAIVKLNSIPRYNQEKSAQDLSLHFIQEIAASTGSASSARDGLRAAAIVASGGLPGPLSALAAARTLATALGADTQAVAWLSAIAPSSIPASVSSSDIASSGSGTISVAPTGQVSAGGDTFVIFPQVKRTDGEIIPTFGISTREVTKRHWADFLAENPRWRAANRDALIAEGLVDSSYLETFETLSDEMPVTGISWHAATAYTEWRSARSGSYRIILPSEAMWNIASAWASSDPRSSNRAILKTSSQSTQEPLPAGWAGQKALFDMLGNVWEWTSDDFTPYPRLSTLDLSFPDRAKSVRGGSFANDADEVTMDSRGGVYPAHSSPFLGFRLAVLPR